MPPTKTGRLALLKLGMKLAVGAMLLWYVISMADWSEAHRYLADARWGYVALFAAVVPFSVGVSVLKWQRLLAARGNPIGYRRLYGLYVLGQFYNNVLPSSVGGDVIRAVLIRRDVGSTRIAVSSIAAERLTGMAVIVAMAVAAVLGSQEIRKDWMLVGLAGASVITFVAVMIALFSVRTNTALQAGLSNLPIVKRLLIRFQSLQETMHGYRSCHRVILECLALSVLFYLGTFLSTYLGAQAIGQPVPWATVIVAVPLIHLVSVLPVTLNGIGLKEWAFTASFAALGASPTAGLIVALLLRVREIVWSVGGYAVWTLLDGGQQLALARSVNKESGVDEVLETEQQATVKSRAIGPLRSHKVLLAGIDGSGKSTCLDMLISRLQGAYTVTKVVNKDASIYRNGERFLVYRPVYEAVQSTREASVKYHFYSLFLVVKFFYKMFVIKHVLRRETSDLTMFEIDLLLHPSVYLVYHFPFSRRIGRRLRFRLMSKFTGATPDFSVFYLETDPEVAMERIRKRGVHIAPHENVNDLRALQEEFDRVIEVATELGYRVVRVNTNNRNLAQVADEIESVLAQRLSPA